ncbi:ribokinase [Streptomyces sp.]|uniref:ribokinase n=1 Tax=Streptomyces sp. TaxID=1931 RepID=UPI002F42C32C
MVTGSAGSGKTLLVVGSANADLVVRVPRHPAPGETVLGAADLAVHPGGKGANQAVAAGRLGAAVTFCGRVGRDGYGELLTAELRSAGVNTAGLRVTDEAPTGVALITVAEDGENTIVVAAGANRTLTAAEVEAAFTADVRVVSAQCEVPVEAVRAAARRAPRLVLNPSPPEALVESPYAAEVLAYADPLVVNEHEMRVLLAGRGGGQTEEGGQPEEEGAGRSVRGPEARPEPDGRTEVDADADPAGKPRSEPSGKPVPEELLRLGVRSAVVTLGAAGAVVVESGGRTTGIPAVRVEVVDTTGAGDAFTGALAWRLAEGDDVVTAARWAVRAGAAAVTERGAHLSSTVCGKLRAEAP